MKLIGLIILLAILTGLGVGVFFLVRYLTTDKKKEEFENYCEKTFTLAKKFVPSKFYKSIVQHDHSKPKIITEFC